MTSKPTKAIRVQLPGGKAFAPALLQAVTKTGARSGLSAAKQKSLTKMVKATIAMLNSDRPSTITIEIALEADAVDVRLVGAGCTSPTKKLVKALGALGEKHAASFTDTQQKTQRKVEFRV